MSHLVLLQLRSCSVLLLSLAVLSCLVTMVTSHGRMIDPPSRASMWRFGFNVPQSDYDDNQGYCGGQHQLWNRYNGKCGVCGDAWDEKPRAHEEGGRYFAGTVTKTYLEGDVIEISTDITANHRGWYEFRLCPYESMNPEDKEYDENGIFREVSHTCLDKHLLRTEDGSTRWYLPEPYKVGVYTVRVQLPPGLSCQRCLLQWKWNVANSWGTDPDGTSCVGCGKQEQFYACADVQIQPRSGSYPPRFTPPTAAPPRPPTFPVPVGPGFVPTQFPLLPVTEIPEVPPTEVPEFPLVTFVPVGPRKPEDGPRQRGKPPRRRPLPPPRRMRPTSRPRLPVVPRYPDYDGPVFFPTYKPGTATLPPRQLNRTRTTTTRKTTSTRTTTTTPAPTTRERTTTPTRYIPLPTGVVKFWRWWKSFNPLKTSGEVDPSTPTTVTAATTTPTEAAPAAVPGNPSPSPTGGLPWWLRAEQDEARQSWWRLLSRLAGRKSVDKEIPVATKPVKSAVAADPATTTTSTTTTTTTTTPKPTTTTAAARSAPAAGSQPLPWWLQAEEKDYQPFQGFVFRYEPEEPSSAPSIVPFRDEKVAVQPLQGTETGSWVAEGRVLGQGSRPNGGTSGITAAAAADDINREDNPRVQTFSSVQAHGAGAVNAVAASASGGNGEGRMCSPVGVWVAMKAMWDWCDANCAAGNCPPSHCICSS